MSATRESAAAFTRPAAGRGGIPGDIHGALGDLNVPSYAVDRYGIICWLNPAAQELMGDVRGRRQSSIVAPEQARMALESFTRKMLGTEQSTEGKVVLIGRDGKRVQVEVSSVPLRDGGRIVGVFGVIPHQEKAPAPEPHPHLTPRQNEVLHLIAEGHSTMQIADILSISVETTRNHVRRMLRALDTHSRVEALAVAHRDGLLRPSTRGAQEQEPGPD
jgi:PAS domain S-box-containing protein